MKRALLIGLLFLASCAPQIVRSPERLVYEAKAGELTVTTASPIRYGFFRIIGVSVSSSYCVDKCQPNENGIIYLRLPEGPTYGTHVMLGRYEGNPTKGTAAVVVEGEVDGLDTELTSSR